MKTISVMNYKGGVGKTTLTANLGVQLAWLGHSVLLIDVDPQASLTFSFISPEKWSSDYAAGKTIKSWFDGLIGGDPINLSDLIFSPPHIGYKLKDKGSLDVICSHLGLINLDLELATGMSGGSLSQVKRNFIRVHRYMSDGLAKLGEKEYDFVLIDCPPNFNIITKNSIIASDFILIPAKPDYLSTMGIDYLMRSVSELVKDYNGFLTIDSDKSQADISPEILGVVFTMVGIYSGEPISALRPYIKQTKDLGVPVFNSIFRENKTLFSDAPRTGVPVVLNYYSNPTYATIVEEIEDFVKEFIDKIG